MHPEARQIFHLLSHNTSLLEGRVFFRALFTGEIWSNAECPIPVPVTIGDISSLIGTSHFPKNLMLPRRFILHVPFRLLYPV